MKDTDVFPQWLLDAACGDEAFDAAYAGLPGERRAWIKKTAAQLFEMAGAGAMRSSGLEQCWTQGFCSVRAAAPLDGAVLLLDPGCRSAARVAAAALPAVASGATPLAVCLGGDPAPDALAALELCGLETVAVLDGDGFARLVEHAMQRQARLGVLVLGGDSASEDAAALAFAAPGLDVWTPWTFPAPGAVPDLAAWAGDGADWDLDLIAWAHAGHAVAVWNAPDLPESGGLPEGMVAEQGGFDAFLGAGHRALIVPAARLDEAARFADLVLGPGQEACWAWPGLDAGFFLRRRLCLCGGA